jgi:D-glycero-alpha-D-manno-heptose-7-phosphate kinase
MLRSTSTVEVRVPTRVDLAGGTLDLWPLYCLHQDALTVNAAISFGVRLLVRPGAVPAGRILHQSPGQAPIELSPADADRHLSAAVGFELCPRGGFAVEVLEQPPVGSGLGGSSAFAVALARGCLALTGQHLPTTRLVALLHDLEARVLGAPTGTQDYYPPLLGGVLAIHYAPGSERVERLPIPRAWLAPRLAVVFTGLTHASGMVNWEVYRRRINGDSEAAAALAAIALAAAACRSALLAGDEAAVGRAIGAEWAARRRLAPAVAPPELTAIIDAAVAAGALAGKACGAGGGGSVVLWTPPSQRPAAVGAALAAAPAGAFEIPGPAGAVRHRVRILAAT